MWNLHKGIVENLQHIVARGLGGTKAGGGCVCGIQLLCRNGDAREGSLDISRYTGKVTEG